MAAKKASSRATQDEGEYDGIEGGWDCAEGWVCSRPSGHGLELTSLPGEEGGSEVERVYSLSHDISAASGERIRVTEYFTILAWLRRPPRAVLLLQGSVFKGNSWSIPSPGYNVTEMIARRGMFVYSVDYLGTGESSIPADGREASFERNLDLLKILLQRIRRFRSVPRVDLIGEGFGAYLAAELSADGERVCSCTLTNAAYRDIVAGPAKSPEMAAYITGAPSGYFSVTFDAYSPFLAGAPPEVCGYIGDTQPGSYPISVMLPVLSEPPFFDPSVARAPGLVIAGRRDFVLGPSDAEDLAADYGRNGAELVVSDTGGHAMRIESPASAGWFWAQALDFIDGD